MRHGGQNLMHPDYKNRPTSGLRAFNVYLGRRCIDTVFYSKTDKITEGEVYNSLVNHDGYDGRILVQEEK